jgi:4-amino-4-deoxy-L-arabinose transferase-like glycosyltransferase
MSRRATPSTVSLAYLVLVFAPLYLWGLGTVGFQDPDEGMYAEIAREMLISGNWVVPTFNGVPYLEKPPLMLWLTAGTLAALGPSEFAARLWKVLPVLGAVALTGALGRRLFSARVGIVAAGVLATTVGSFLFSRISQMDPLLLIAVALAAYGVVRADDRPGGAADLWFWGGIAIGVMSKGLPGLAFPASLLGLWMLIRWDDRVLRVICTWRGGLMALLVILPWHVLVAWQVPGFLDFYFVDNQILRFFGARAYVEDGGSLGSLAFLGVTLCALFPWAPLLTAALGLHERGGTAGAGRWFCVGWIGIVVGAFVLSSFKLEYYALPAFPAVALLVSGLVCRANDSAALVHRSALRRWIWISLIGGILYCLLVAGSWRAGLLNPANIVRGLAFWSTNYRVVLEHGLPLPPVSPGPYAVVLLGGGALWVAGFAAAAWLVARKRVLASAAAIGAVGVGLSVLASVILQEVGPHHSLKPLAERLNAILQPDDVVVHERGLEKGGGLLFYTKRQVLVLNGRRGDLEFGSGLPGSHRAFIDTGQFRELWNGRGRTFLVTDLPGPRSAISDGALGASTLIESTGTRWLYANLPLP